MSLARKHARLFLSVFIALFICFIGVGGMASAQDPTGTPTETPTTTPTVTLTPTETPTATLVPTTALPTPSRDLMEYPVLPFIDARTRLLVDGNARLRAEGLLTFVRVGSEQVGALLHDPERIAATLDLTQEQDRARLTAMRLLGYRRVDLSATSFNAPGKFWTLNDMLSTTATEGRAECQPGETLLACELRVNQPAAAFIMASTGDIQEHEPEGFKQALAQVIEITRQQGVAPVLVTMPDLPGLRERVAVYNGLVVEVAGAQEAPLWNLWRALQGLPNGGLVLGDTRLSEEAKRVRDVSALEVLRALYPYDAAVKERNTNLRPGPCTSYRPEIASLPNGARLTVQGRIEWDGCGAYRVWYHVRDEQGQEGWVYSDLVELYADPASLPVITEAPPRSGQNPPEPPPDQQPEPTLRPSPEASSSEGAPEGEPPPPPSGENK